MKFSVLYLCIFFVFTNCAHQVQLTETNLQQEQPVTTQENTSNSNTKKLPIKERYNLEELYLYAVANTERLSIRKEIIKQAEAKKDSFFANFFPSLSFRYQQLITIPNHAGHDRETRNRNNLIYAYSNSVYGTNINTPFNVSNSTLPGSSSSTTNTSPLVRPGSRLVLHIPIMTGFNEWSAYKSSKFEVILRNLELQHDAGRMYLEIAQAYYNLLQLDNNLSTKKEILQLTKNLKVELGKRVRLGRNKASDLSSINSQIAKLESEIVGITDTLSQMKDTVAFLTGAPANFTLERITEKPIQVSLEDIDKIVENRYDISAAKINLEIAKSEVTKAYGGHLPTASIDSFYTFPSGNVTGGAKDIVSQFIFQVPILSLGTVTASVKQAKSLKRQMELQLSQTIRFAKEEISKAYNSYIHSKLMEESYRNALSFSETNYKIVYKDYLSKSATVLDVLNAKIALENSKEELHRTTLQKNLNLVWLKVAMGEYSFSKHKRNLL